MPCKKHKSFYFYIRREKGIRTPGPMTVFGQEKRPLQTKKQTK